MWFACSCLTDPAFPLICSTTSDTALRRENVNLLRREIIVNESATDVHGHKVFGKTKNRQSRTIAVPGFLSDILANHLQSAPTEPDSVVFTGSTEERIDWTNYRNRIWKPALTRAGLDQGLRMHDLRHTAASMLIAQGGRPKVVLEHLGHSSIILTMDRYGHMYPEDRSKVADALDAAILSSGRATA